MICCRKLCRRNHYSLTKNPSSSCSSSFHSFSSTNPNLWSIKLNSHCKSFRFLSSTLGFSLTPHKLSGPNDANFVIDHVFKPSFSRNYCFEWTSDGGFGEWTEEIQYLVESGSVIYSGKGIRSVEPGLSDHVMVGGLKSHFWMPRPLQRLLRLWRGGNGGQSWKPNWTNSSLYQIWLTLSKPSRSLRIAICPWVCFDGLRGSHGINQVISVMWCCLMG